ncbi:MAG TPA: tripartite tricarboxylate transporter substrate binding protein [Burkholderiales bacterium]|jgi:tripartite-type tricarboxylate transporter receptor subunit TctC
MTTFRQIAAAACAAMCALACGAAQAQQYPNRPIRVIVPYAAGGAADITARMVTQKMGESMGVSFVVDNRGGANGGIGTDVVAKAAPDGYTILVDASGPVVVNPVLYTKVPYDPEKDLAPVSLLCSYQYVLVVRNDSPITSLKDLIAKAKEKPGALSFGSTGVGGGNHLAGVLLGLRTGTKLTHVPYKGSALALADLLGGQLSFMYDTIVTSAPHIKSGKLRPFAVSSNKRSSSLPDVPTMEEAGVKDFNISQFQGMLVPAKTDPAIIARLHDEAVKALKDPNVFKHLGPDGGNEIVGGTPAEFARQIKSDLSLYGKLIKQANVKVD